MTDWRRRQRRVSTVPRSTACSDSRLIQQWGRLGRRSENTIFFYGTRYGTRYTVHGIQLVTRFSLPAPSNPATIGAHPEMLSHALSTLSAASQRLVYPAPPDFWRLKPDSCWRQKKTICHPIDDLFWRLIDDGDGSMTTDVETDRRRRGRVGVGVGTLPAIDCDCIL